MAVVAVHAREHSHIHSQSASRSISIEQSVGQSENGMNTHTHLHHDSCLSVLLCACCAFFARSLSATSRFAYLCLAHPLLHSEIVFPLCEHFQHLSTKELEGLKAGA